MGWSRWKKRAIDDQLRTAKGAERYIRSGKRVYLEANKQKSFPIDMSKCTTFHKFIVAHGANEACKRFSKYTSSGSLPIFYGGSDRNVEEPFVININRGDNVHVIDSHSLPILFSVLDTFADFVDYIDEKERAISRYRVLAYSSEEDLLAYYFGNYDRAKNRYLISDKRQAKTLVVAEGFWKKFCDSGALQRRQRANLISY